MSTYSHEAYLNNIRSYVNDMTCRNNLDINEFQKGDDNMMQCVTCNKLLLFAPRLKVLLKQGKYKCILVE
jgi:hypothetical protein